MKFFVCGVEPSVSSVFRAVYEIQYRFNAMRPS